MSDTLVDSFGLVYVLIGALVGVAHGSVHGVQTLAPRLTSVHGIKQLVGGEKAVHGGAVTGTPCPPSRAHHLLLIPAVAVTTVTPCHKQAAGAMGAYRHDFVPRQVPPPAHLRRRSPRRTALAVRDSSTLDVAACSCGACAKAALRTSKCLLRGCLCAAGFLHFQVT